MDTGTLYTIIHLFGVALGAGGAFVSDGMFMYAIRDKKLSHTEIGFLKLASIFVWVGLLVLIISGYLLFSLDPEKFLASSKFLVKMTIIGVLIVNGIIFHLMHMPAFMKYANTHMHMSAGYRKASYYIYASGAISIVSWSLALVLGALRSISVGYWQAMLAYGLIIVCAVAASLYMRKRFMVPV